MQRAVALAREGHTVPHAPQLRASVSTETSQPLEEVMSQSA